MSKFYTYIRVSTDKQIKARTITRVIKDNQKEYIVKMSDCKEVHSKKLLTMYKILSAIYVYDKYNESYQLEEIKKEIGKDRGYKNFNSLCSELNSH